MYQPLLLLPLALIIHSQFTSKICIHGGRDETFRLPERLSQLLPIVVYGEVRGMWRRREQLQRKKHTQALLPLVRVLYPPVLDSQQHCL